MDLAESQLTKLEVERRQYRRVKLVTQVHCEAPERDEIMVTRDVSLGGMFINVNSPLPIDSELSLAFRVAPAGPPIACRGRVMFSRAWAWESSFWTSARRPARRSRNLWAGAPRFCQLSGDFRLPTSW